MKKLIGSLDIGEVKKIGQTLDTISLHTTYRLLDDVWSMIFEVGFENGVFDALNLITFWWIPPFNPLLHALLKRKQENFSPLEMALLEDKRAQLRSNRTSLYPTQCDRTTSAVILLSGNVNRDAKLDEKTKPRRAAAAKCGLYLRRPSGTSLRSFPEGYYKYVCAHCAPIPLQSAVSAQLRIDSRARSISQQLLQHSISRIVQLRFH
jgi:hypothetical protein